MNKEINDIFTYHNETKHSSRRYARSLGYMDWSTQPDPFRSYTNTQKVPLPLSLQNPTPPYHLIFEETLPCAPVMLESISQLFQFSLGLAAWKEAGASKWALRCNASSGNLHPSESYIILPPVNKISDQSSISHYAPKHHQLEKLCEFDTNFWNDLEEGSFLLAISSITWREVWKYGERAFRYCSLDAGHALRAVQISAMMLGWKVQLLDDIDDSDINKLLGFDQEKRFIKDGKVWTSAGVSAGIDMALELIAQEAGEETAGKVQLYAEYYPAGTLYGTAHKEPQAPGYIKT